MRSEVITETTGNAAADGLSWVMSNIIPEATGLQVDGVYFRYTTIKEENADLLVTIRNSDNAEVGYIYSRTDDWSGLPGNTIIGYDPLAPTLGSRWGDGEIVTEGDGSVVDASIRYHYRFDTCLDPLNDPSCPGFENALYKYLLDNDLLNKEPDFNDPYYDEWVQAQLDRETEVDEEEVKETEEEAEEEDLGKQLGAEVALTDLGNQTQLLSQLNNVPQFDSYYGATISGGVYNDVLTIEDAELTDNRRALRTLANDSLHRTMIRSQYEENNGEN